MHFSPVPPSLARQAHSNLPEACAKGAEKKTLGLGPARHRLTAHMQQLGSQQKIQLVSHICTRRHSSSATDFWVSPNRVSPRFRTWMHIASGFGMGRTQLKTRGHIVSERRLQPCAARWLVASARDCARFGLQRAHFQGIRVHIVLATGGLGFTYFHIIIDDRFLFTKLSLHRMWPHKNCG